MAIQSTFKRYELKYLLTVKQKQMIMELFENYMSLDQYGRMRISNIYYDTDDFLLIRRSLERGIYKEKLRLRAYGQVNRNSEVFLEIKKKFDKVVYKRRISLLEKDAMNYFEKNIPLQVSQISKEIDYFKSFYQGLSEKMYIAYEREAYFGKKDKDFRITFDDNIVWRTNDLSLCQRKYGEKIISENMVLMEIKVAGGIPLWLTAFLTEHKINKTSFSKYGNAYMQMILRGKERNNAA